MLKHLHTGKDHRKITMPSSAGDNSFIHRPSNLFTGVPAINLAGIDPLLINRIQLQQGADSPVNVELTFNDVELTGLKDHTCTFVK